MPFFIHVVVELDFDLWLIDSLHYRADLDPIVQCSSVSSSLSIREERVINKKHKLGKRELLIINIGGIPSFTTGWN